MGGISNLDLLERELYLKTLQIKSLLYITQSINRNVSSEELFKIYNHTLGFELQIPRMALFFNIENKWKCVTDKDLKNEIGNTDLTEVLLEFDRIQTLPKEVHPLLQQFDIVIPIFHKDEPIAYSFIGEMEDNDAAYEKMQFISTITSMIAVAIENKRLFKKQLEQERMGREMELAIQVQNMLIPSEFPMNEHYELDGRYKPHRGVGGDYFDFFERQENLMFCIADVSGKGVAAALLMANFQANLRALIGKKIDPKVFIAELNNSVLRITKSEKFLTFFIGRYNRADQKLTYISAGHNPSLLLMDGEIHRLSKGCTILGYFDVIPEIEVGEVFINDEALIFTYTDGLTDQTNNSGETFTLELLEQFLTKNAHLPVHDINEKLMQHIELFRENVAYTDDIALLTCKIF